MSIPILSMLRLFGGIPWPMLMVGLCLTLATMFLVGSLSQLLSLYIRNGFMVVAMVGIVLAVAWGLFPILIFFGWALWNNHIMTPRCLEFLVMSVNPYFAFIDQLAAFSTRLRRLSVAWFDGHPATLVSSQRSGCKRVCNRQANTGARGVSSGGITRGVSVSAWLSIR
jgi:hypothetical protein